ncbi:MAG: cache domain-containing protein, partial [Campylobacteraceae bacterium]|nr:cache domain-containing protein [Campylobacteraceae bacterium]
MFSEKNIPKLIVLTPIFTIIILVVIILYSFIKTQKEYFITESTQLESDYIQKQEVILQKEIGYIFNYIDYHKNLMLDNTKKNIKIQMNAFSQLLIKQQSNHQKYQEYVIQNANSNTDFIIYDINNETLYKDPDVFFEDFQIEDIKESLQNLNTMFVLEDETNLHFYQYLPKEKIIIVLIKDIFYNLDDLKYSIARWVEYIRFGNNNYFWIHTNTNKLLAHP